MSLRVQGFEHRKPNFIIFLSLPSFGEENDRYTIWPVHNLLKNICDVSLSYQVSISFCPAKLQVTFYQVFLHTHT